MLQLSVTCFISQVSNKLQGTTTAVVPSRLNNVTNNKYKLNNSWSELTNPPDRYLLQGSMTHQLAPVGRQLFPAIFPMAAFHRIRHNPAENVWNIILQEYSKENSQEVKMGSMKNTPCPHLGRVQSWHRGYCADLLLLLHAANW